MKYCIASVLIQVSINQWVMQVDHFSGKTISSKQGWLRSPGNSPNTYTCDQSNYHIIEMEDNRNLAYQTFTLLPHYEIKVISDIYFRGEWDNARRGQLKLDSTVEFVQYYRKTNMTTYQKVCGDDSKDELVITTVVVNKVRSASTLFVEYYTSLDSTSNEQRFGFRNFNIYIKKCHYSCKFCSGPANTQCTACFTGSPNGGGQCSQCSGSTSFLDPGQGCILQCDRDGYLGDSNNICIENPNINSLDSAFTGASISSLNPWVGVVDSIFSTTSITNRYTTCSSVAIIGPFKFNEAVQYSLSLSTAIQYIRVRATFYLFNTWEDYAAIQIMLDDYPMGSIYSLTNNILSRNAIILSQSSVASCNSMSPVKIIRIEIIIRTTSTSPVLKFKGNMNPTSTQAWGGRDFTIDSQVCQSNCATCSNAMTCTSCSGGLKLHKGTCVSTCPTYSVTSGSNCIDFDEAVPYATYLVKAFYDSSTTDDEMVASLVDSTSSLGTPNLQTGGVYFSHIPNKRVLGGVLVWFKMGFTKSFTITQPHYAVRVVMSVILGDDFSGTFQYTFHTNSEVTLTSSSGNLGSGSSSIWGKSTTDRTVQIDVVVPHTTSTFQVELKCQSSRTNIKDNFCAVQDYFIVVHLCRQFCLSSCTNASNCSSALTLPANLATSSPIACNTGFYYDSTTLTCPACSTIGTGCLQCSSSTLCTTCASNFQTSSGGCRCLAQFYLNGSSCSACSPYCNTCYNSGQTNCLECYTAQFRYLSVNTCLCIDYYYDDGTNTTCQACFPLCKTCTNAPNGNCSACSPATNVEKVGNFCNCKPTFYYHTTSKDCQTCEFTCYYCNGGNSNNCTNCDDANRNRVLTGNTCPCKSGYYQNASNVICSQCVIPTTDAVPACYHLCGNGIVEWNEECDDMNALPYDGCFGCYFQCQPACTTCTNGICSACNTSGWLFDAITKQCFTTCGDLIRAGSEQCDDGNDIMFDGCYNCSYQCQIECTNCVNGQCYACSTGWYVNTIDRRCYSLCGDQIVVGTEQCDDDNNLPYDGCYFCQYQCQIECTNCINGQCYECNTLGWYINNYSRKCETLCQDGIQAGLEICDDGNMIAYDGCFNCQYSCQVECSNCVSGVCVNCIAGWQLNQALSICIPVCGDLTIVGSEQCDDGNYLEFDGCLNCSYQCQNECSSCNYGVCANCILGYKLNQFIICEQICGDLILVGTEKCDDGNDIPFDGCHNCQYSCQPQCTLCQQGICRQCNESLGWYLNTVNNQCETFCSDLILAGNEQCEDSNYLPNDGCFECNYSCPSNCLTCYQGICSNCQVGYNLIIQTCEPICGDGLIIFPEVCDDSNDQQFDGCFQCQYQCQEECQDCMLGRCYNCNYGWVLNDLTGQCSTLCGDLIVAGLEQCEDQNNLSNDGCSSCQYQCSQYCNNCNQGICQDCIIGWQLIQGDCLAICGDQIIVSGEQCDDGNLIPYDGCNQCTYQCQDECTNCINGQCVACNTVGWIVDELNYYCVPVCGDGIVVGYEECDDANNVPQDGCSACKFECQSQCLTCNYGVCDLCATGWELTNSFQCIPVCGDMIVIGQEMCDDGNQTPFDGCYDCNYSCQEVCLSCLPQLVQEQLLGVCNLCADGWYLSSDNYQCYSICGDLILVEYEQCDDGNNVAYDGCFQCSYQCQLECLICLDGICQQCDETNGWYLNQNTNTCVTQCQDGILAGQEECDDENNEPFDGCFTCQYSCQDECQLCVKGRCHACLDGWELDQQQRCQAICGDLIIQPQEQCDDQNSFQFDGCYMCQYQCQFECSSCQFGICNDCYKGWMLDNEFNQCQSLCGDQVLVGTEECDDGNDIPFDGCHNCQYSCQPQCTLCQQGNCRQCNESLGWYLNTVNNQCETFCSDLILAGNEQCEDSNYLPNDGCFECNYSCPSNCLTCYEGLCSNCQVGYTLIIQTCEPICGDGLIIFPEVCDDSNDQQFDGCFQCQYQCQEECQDCMLGRCYNCNYGWVLNDLTGQCSTLCGDLIVAGLEQCEDQNNLSNDGCSSCQYQCSQYCNNCNQGICQDCIVGYQLILGDCLSICGDQIIVSGEQCDDGNLIPYDGCNQCTYQCQDECTNCINGQCVACNTVGWIVDELNYYCVPVCGDGIVVGYEECDDANNVPQDGCSACKFECQSQCLTCNYGVCDLCATGWELTNSFQCIPVCGDMIVIGQEMCDDGNQTPFDGCYDCNYSCQEVCLSCLPQLVQEQLLGVCNLCADGWYLSSDNYQCYSICGDLILVEYEQCDDGNNVAYDGCFQCSYQCQLECLICLDGICQQCDETNGWYLNQNTNTCVTQCQDGILAGQEECDDENNEPFDGCFTCQYSCQDECQLCVKGRCHACLDGWELDQQQRCQAICGDLIIQPQEQCDDQNSFQFDGCYMCQYQCQFECSSCQFGICNDCYKGWMLDNEFNQCQSLCGDQVLVGTEECDDGNDIPFDGCHNCQYSCQPQCTLCQQGNCRQCNESLGWYLNTVNNQCETFCSDLILAGNEQCEDSNYLPNDGCFECNYSCPSNCLTCYEGLCSNCQVGYTLIIQTCEPICGDGLIIFPEVCDDSNDQQFDGCFQCQYQCQEECQDCMLGRCYNCNYGWVLNDLTGQCSTLCGDLIVAGLEQCEDQNNLSYDGCSSCQYQCSQYCNTCNQGICQDCIVGYQLILGDCLSICGDQIIVSGEQCDDGNLIPYDGCNQCTYQCQDECTNCINGQCVACNTVGWIVDELNYYCVSVCGDGIVVGYEECDDANNVPQDGCSACKFECQSQCLTCNYGVCDLCATGWELNNSFQCIPVCGDMIVIGQEMCDDGNQTPFDGCYDCNYSCQEVCTQCPQGNCVECGLPGWYLNSGTKKCQGICGDGIVVDTEDCEDGNIIPFDGCFDCKYSCQNECTKCNFGVCYECNTLGWVLDSHKCKTVCGDGIVAGLEDCDDGNLNPFDNCNNNCQFACQRECTICHSGACFECNTAGWKWDEYTCITTCGDMITAGLEECDDGNLIEYDGCSNDCQYQCQQECTKCPEGICKECNTTGWTLNNNNECLAICGDGLIISKQEECDDGNNIPYDGCFECQFQCQTECSICQRGKCMQCNTLGWQLSNDKCIPICGDGLVVGDEVCDDFNNIKNDGCYECKYQCHEACVQCINGRCMTCQFGWYPVQGTCMNLCGDSILIITEEACDDGNLNNQDGCNDSCQVEQDWVCFNNDLTTTSCEYAKQPEILLELIPMDSTSRIEQQVSLKFTQPVQLSFDSQIQFEELINIILQGLSLNDYHYNITSIQKPQVSLSEVEFVITVTFQVTVDYPLLQIEIEGQLINQYRQTLKSNTDSISLKSVTILSANEKELAESTTQINNIIMYSLIALASLSILTGSLDLVFNLLDTLQYLSYIKYVNYQFPPNLNIYFEVFNQVSLGPILTFCGVDSLISEFSGGTTPFIAAQYKFQDDKLNAYFLVNIISFVFVISSGYAGFFINLGISKLLYKLRPHALNSLGGTTTKLIMMVRQYAQQNADAFHYSGILRILMSSTYDIGFAVILQLTYSENDSADFTINYISAVGFLLAQCGLIFFLLEKLKTQQGMKLRHEASCDSLYEGVSTNQNNFWTIQFNSIIMIKKMVFIVIIVTLQKNPAIQTILVSMNAAFFVSYLRIAEPLSNRIELYKMMINDCVIVLATIGFLGYDDILGQYVSLIGSVLLGWIHIALFSSILSTQLGLDIYQQVIQMKQLIRKHFFKERKKEFEPTILMFY